MSRLILSRPVVAFVFFVERYVCSFLNLFLAWEYLSTLRLIWLLSHTRGEVPASLLAHDGNFRNGVTFDDFARYILLTLSLATGGVLLLCSRRPKHGPRTAAEVAVPFAATFSSVALASNLPLPAWAVTPLIPDDWKPLLTSVGIALSLAGLTMAVYASCWLGRSMGIVVSVREVVLAGPYRWVRHPIYLSYLIVMLGTFMVSWTPRMGLMAVGCAALLVWRARLEEGFLRAHSPAYRERMARVGFLWPRWHAPAPARMVAEVG